MHMHCKLLPLMKRSLICTSETSRSVDVQAVASVVYCWVLKLHLALIRVPSAVRHPRIGSTLIVVGMFSRRCFNNKHHLM